MALFSTAKESLMIVGLLAVPEDKLPKILRKYQSVIHKAHVIIFITCILIYLFSSLHFLLFKANAVSQYIESGSYVVLNIMRIIVYPNLRSGMEKMSDLWNELEITAEKRKFARFVFPSKFKYFLKYNF